MQSETDIDRALRRLVHGPITLARAAAAYVEQTHLAKNTRDGIASFLRGAGASLASVEIAELSADRIQTWLNRLRVSPEARQQYWHRLRSIVRFAAGRGWIGRVPWEGWRPVFRYKKTSREREAVRDLEELARLFEGAREEDEARRARGLLPDVEPKIATSTALGLRQGELAGLRWIDLREAEGVVVIARQWNGDDLPKGKRVKALATGPELFVLLERYRQEVVSAGLYAADGPIFPNVKESARGSPRAYSRGEVLTRRILRAVVRRAHLPNEKAWSAHSMRDTFATLEERTHADLRILAERTRHASLGSLLRYLRARRRDPPSPGFVLPEPPNPPRLPPSAVDKK